MKTATPAKRTRASGKTTAPSTHSGRVTRKAGKKTRDLSWLLDRPLPPDSELPENPVLYLRRLS